ncbi:MAG: hypothetical protein S4CHLAM2_06000 [Chlamydiales bacterium]|nr:hypothetical protein [Chlamydiales bacterium]
MTRYWLMKSEPTCYSIDDLERMHTTSWDGVRNYQARNIMRDEMQVGDLAFFYHSSCNPAGIVGLCRVCKEAHPDYTAWDPKSDHFDPKASPDKPIWMMVDVEFVEKFPNVITLHELKQHPELEELMVTQRGSRLSVQPVSAHHFQFILNLK